jgi:ABC-2 type transport system permease protein
MISFHRLRVVMAHELRMTSRDWSPVAVMLIFPVISMAFLKPAFQPALEQAGYKGANGAEQVVPGQAVIAAFFVVSLVVFAFFTEYGGSTWDRLRASRAASIEIILGKTLPRIALTVVQFVVVLIAGVLIFEL